MQVVSLRYKGLFCYTKAMKLRQWLFFLTIIGVGILVIINAGQFHSFLGLLSNVRWYGLVLILIFQLLGYYTSAKYYESFFAVFGKTLQMGRLLEASLAVNFVNYILPSAGLAGAGYLSQVTQPEIPRGQATLAQFVRQALNALGTLFILPLGFVLLFLGNDVAHLSVRLVL